MILDRVSACDVAFRSGGLPSVRTETHLERDNGVVVGILHDGFEVVEEHHVGAVVREDVGPRVEDAQHPELHALRAQRLDQPVWECLVMGVLQGSIDQLPAIYTTNYQQPKATPLSSCPVLCLLDSTHPDTSSYVLGWCTCRFFPHQFSPQFVMFWTPSGAPNMLLLSSASLYSISSCRGVELLWIGLVECV